MTIQSFPLSSCWRCLQVDLQSVYSHVIYIKHLKMISSPYCAVWEPNVYKHYKRLTRWNANCYYSLRITYLIFEAFQTLFPTALFYSCEGFHQVIDQEERSIKFRVKNGGWHESLNLLHVSRCEMLHFVTSYMKQNKSRKQTLESAQYGLEISFKLLFIDLSLIVVSHNHQHWKGSKYN